MFPPFRKSQSRNTTNTFPVYAMFVGLKQIVTKTSENTLVLKTGMHYFTYLIMRFSSKGCCPTPCTCPGSCSTSSVLRLDRV